MKCIVNANPSPVVDWLRNKDLITPTGHFVIDTDGLLIKNVTLDDDGTYTCRARVMHTGELAERNIKVEVSVFLHCSLEVCVYHIHSLI